MYRLVIERVHGKTQRATLMMTRENAAALSKGDLLALGEIPGWRVLNIHHLPMTLGALKRTRHALENMAIYADDSDEDLTAIDTWNYVVVCNELQDAERELLTGGR